MKPAYGRYLAFPFRIAGGGRTASVSGIDEHVHDELIQLILTAVGERLFLPEFGTNVRRLVFENTDDAVASLTKSTVSHALAQWLGDRVHVDSLEVAFAASTINVALRYRVQGGGQGSIAFQRKVGS